MAFVYRSKNKTRKGSSMNIKLELTQEETGFLMGVLAELPTRTGAWTLIQKIKEQAETQVPTQQKKEETLNG